MFIPNTTASVRRRTGTNVRAEEVFGAASTIACAVVRLEAKEQKTSVRADSSASRGAADEHVTDAKMLFPKTFRPQKGDRVLVQSIDLRVVSVHPRLNVLGLLDHYETDLMHWV